MIQIHTKFCKAKRRDSSKTEQQIILSKKCTIEKKNNKKMREARPIVD
jgi:hypothetical protein